MKIMETIGKGFGVAGRNIGVLMVLFIFNVVWNLATLPFIGNEQTAPGARVSLPVLILGAIFILINIFIQGGVLGVLKDAIASGGKAVLKNIPGYGSKFYMRFVGLGLLVILIVAVVVLITGVLFAISTVIKNIIVNIIIVTLAAIIIAIVLYYLFLLFFSPYVIVVNDAKVIESMKTSMQFIRQNLWKVTGLSTLLVLIGLGLGFIVGILSGVVSIVAGGITFQIITSILASAVNAYITVIISAALLLYYCALSGGPEKKEAPTEVSSA